MRALLFSLLIACTPQEYKTVCERSEPLTALQEAKWPGLEIVTCWETLDPEFDRFKDYVEAVVEWGWNQAFRDPRVPSELHVQLVGFRPCVGGEDIPITISNHGTPSAVGSLGNKIKKLHLVQGVHNFVAVTNHEFAHALGFSHEHNRSDAPSWCDIPSQGVEPDLYLGEFDKESSTLSTYCGDIKEQEWPSAGDIMWLRWFYYPEFYPEVSCYEIRN